MHIALANLVSILRVELSNQSLRYSHWRKLNFAHSNSESENKSLNSGLKTSASSVSLDNQEEHNR